MNYCEMTVKELREETKTRKLPQQKNGKKFTKDELIKQLEEYDCKLEKDEPWEVSPESEENEDWGNDTYTGEEPQEPQNENNAVYEEIGAADNGKGECEETEPLEAELTEIVKKYSGGKKDYIYNNHLKIGSMVVFEHKFTANNGRMYRRLRYAHVIMIRRTERIVVIEMYFGGRLKLSFDDLLYVSKPEDGKAYVPKDIKLYMAKQRTYNKKVRADIKNVSGFENL